MLVSSQAFLTWSPGCEGYFLLTVSAQDEKNDMCGSQWGWNKIMITKCGNEWASGFGCFQSTGLFVATCCTWYPWMQIISAVTERKRETSWCATFESEPYLLKARPTTSFFCQDYERLGSSNRTLLYTAVQGLCIILTDVCVDTETQNWSKCFPEWCIHEQLHRLLRKIITSPMQAQIKMKVKLSRPPCDWYKMDQMLIGDYPSGLLGLWPPGASESPPTGHRWPFFFFFILCVCVKIWMNNCRII